MWRELYLSTNTVCYFFLNHCLSPVMTVRSLFFVFQEGKKDQKVSDLHLVWLTVNDSINTLEDSGLRLVPTVGQ